MIQRIQTLFLLLVCGLMAATALLPLFQFSVPFIGNEIALYSCGIYNIPDAAYPTWGIIFMASLSGLLSFINIFLFKKRKIQIKLGNITSLFILLFYLTVGVYLYTFVSKQGDFSDFTLTKVYAIILPLIALILNIMAVSKIKKDEKLVRSLDRIR